MFFSKSKKAHISSINVENEPFIPGKIINCDIGNGSIRIMFAFGFAYILYPIAYSLNMRDLFVRQNKFAF